MTFKYKINLEIDVDFDAPLLGTDTTKGKRSRTDMIAKVALAEMIKFKLTTKTKMAFRIIIGVWGHNTCVW